MARPPPKVVVTACVLHARGVPHVAAIVSQCGHGTGMKALAQGIPLVCLPLGGRPARGSGTGSGYTSHARWP
jgi:UDP:flavonoid glycosyltransferase YjiC (YdhE family)